MQKENVDGHVRLEKGFFFVVMNFPVNFPQIPRTINSKNKNLYNLYKSSTIRKIF